MASHKREEGEWGSWSSVTPSLHDREAGKPCGAVLPLSENARTQIRDSMEVIEYLLNEENIVWS